MWQRHDRDQSESQECITVDSCFGLFSPRQYSMQFDSRIGLYHVSAALSFLRSSISLAVSRFLFFICWLIRSFIDSAYIAAFCSRLSAF